MFIHQRGCSHRVGFWCCSRQNIRGKKLGHSKFVLPHVTEQGGVVVGVLREHLQKLVIQNDVALYRQRKGKGRHRKKFSGKETWRNGFFAPSLVVLEV